MALPQWLLHRALEKAIKRSVQVIVAWLVAHQVNRFGITIDPAQLTVALVAGSEVLRNWLKVRFQIDWL